MSPIATLNHTPHTTSPCSLLAVTEQHLRVGGPLLRGRLSRALPFRPQPQEPRCAARCQGAAEVGAGGDEEEEADEIA